MVKLRIRQLAEEKVYHLLSRVTGVSEEDINRYLTDSGANYYKIAQALDESEVEDDISQVFEMLSPEKAKKNSIKLLSQASGISEEMIKIYEANEDVHLTTKKTIADLQALAQVLDISVLELVKPVAKKEAVKLKIVDLAQNQGISLTQLSEKAKVELPIICFYSTQPIEKHKLEEPQFQENLRRISQALNCSIEELQDTNKVELPATSLRIQEFLDERNLTLEELRLLTGMTGDFLNLIASNPIDMNSLNIPSWIWGEGDEAILCHLVCGIFGCQCA